MFSLRAYPFRSLRQIWTIGLRTTLKRRVELFRSPLRRRGDLNGCLRALLFDLDDTLLVDEAVSQEVLGIVAAGVAGLEKCDVQRFVQKTIATAKKIWRKGPCYPLCRSLGISALECLWGNFLVDGVVCKNTMHAASSDEAQRMPAFAELRPWALWYRKEVFRQTLMELGLADSHLEIITEQCVHNFTVIRRQQQRLFPETRAVLEELSQDYRLGLLTNGAADLQREKIEASGLRDLFSAIVISGEHGIGKPEPAIFQQLLKELGVTAQEAMMVGNSLERDIAGAHAAGICSVWINLPGVNEQSDSKPDFTITELRQLLPIVEKIHKDRSDGRDAERR